MKAKILILTSFIIWLFSFDACGFSIKLKDACNTGTYNGQALGLSTNSLKDLYYVNPKKYILTINPTGHNYRFTIILSDGNHSRYLDYTKIDNDNLEIDLAKYNVCDGNFYSLTVWASSDTRNDEGVDRIHLINTAYFKDLTSEDGIYYTVHDGEAYVIGSDNEIETANIKSFYNFEGSSYPVTKINYLAFCNRPNLTKISIPTSLKYIGFCAFGFCNNLRVFETGDYLSQIDDSAFMECKNLTRVTLGTGLKFIHPNTFKFSYPKKCIWLANTPPEGCYSFGFGSINYASNKSYPNNFKIYEYLSSMFEVDGTFFVPISPSDRTCSVFDSRYDETNNKVNLTENIIYKGVELKILDINDYSYFNNPYIKEVSIYNTLNIRESTFQSCDSISSILLNVNEIEESAFKGCSAIVKAEIEANVIGESAFQNCSTLEDADYIIKADSIGVNAFNGCASIIKAEVVANQISEGAFQSASQNKPAQYFIKTHSIDKNAFSGCTAIVNAEIEANEIAEGAFQNSSQKEPSIYKITADNIGNNAFNGCASIVKAVVNSKIIGEGAFKNSFTTNPAEVYLKNVEVIGYQAFYNASAMNDIDLNEGIKYIQNEAFTGCSNLEVVSIPNSVRQIGSATFKDCVNLNNIEIGSGILILPSSLLANCSSLSKITIPANINTIENSVFSGCSALEKVVVTDRIKTLNLGINGTSNPLFSECPLKEIYIGGDIVYNTTKNSGYSPFYSNSYLEKVEINNRETEISDYEFYGCSNLKSISMGNGVRRIGKYAFSGCSSLKSFSFGTGMKTIEPEAFSDCTALTSLTSHALMPPTCGTQALDDINKWECQLTVPEQAVYNYKSADQWKEFFFINGEEFDDDYTIYPSRVIIDIPEVTLYENETLKLSALVEPDDASDQTIIWSSKDDSIAAVSKDGIITGVGVGKTEIIATCGDVFDTCEVSVIEKVEATSISLNSTKLELIVNETFLLQATVSPKNATDKTVTWESSDSQIASVSQNGFVKAISAGNTTITAKCGNVSTICDITVKEPIVAQEVGFKNLYNNITYNDLTYSTNDQSFICIPEITGPYNDEDFSIELWFRDNGNHFSNYIYQENSGEYAGNYVQTNFPRLTDVGKYIYTLKQKKANPYVKLGRTMAYVTITQASNNFEWNDPGVFTIHVDETKELDLSYGADIWCEFNVWGNNSLIQVTREHATSNNPKWYVKGIKTGETRLEIGIKSRINSMYSYNFSDSPILSKYIIVEPKQVGSVEGILTEEDGYVSIYTPEGILVKNNVYVEMINNLSSGVYIIVTESGKTYKIVK